MVTAKVRKIMVRRFDIHLSFFTSPKINLVLAFTTWLEGKISCPITTLKYKSLLKDRDVFYPFPSGLLTYHGNCQHKVFVSPNSKECIPFLPYADVTNNRQVKG